MTSRFHYDLVAFVIFALVIAFGVPALMNYDGFELNTFARYLALAIVSMALALSWGTAGLLNLGQAATFGMGSYAMAMHLKLRASGGVDALGFVTVGVALPLGRALIKTGTEEALPLDPHRQFERMREYRSDVPRTICNQLFQDRLNRRILALVHSLFSMVVFQPHGIPEWAAPAGARPGRGSWPRRQANFQT